MRRRKNKNLYAFVFIIILIFGMLFVTGKFKFSVYEQTDVLSFKADINNCNKWGECTSFEPIRIGNYELRIKKIKSTFDPGTGECLLEAEIYDNGVLVGKTPDEVNGMTHTWSWTDGKLRIDFPYGYNGPNSECLRYRLNIYYYIPDDILHISVNTTKSHYIQGEDVTLNLNIENTFLHDLIGNVNIRICQPTFLNPYCVDFKEENVSIKTGKTTLNVEISSDFVVSVLDVYPGISLDMYSSELFDSDDIQRYGIKYIPSGTTVGYSIPEKFHIASFEGDKYEVQIMPKPIYLDIACNEEGTSCPEGYSCKEIVSGSGRYGCLNNEVLDLELHCQIFGCPVSDEGNYICSSSGICVEQIYQVVDCRETGCPEGQTCIEGDEFAYCLKTELVEVISQCKTADDCMIPCPGISVSCINGLCNYEGSCEKEKVEVGCKELGCPEGYECDEIKNVCKRTEYVPIEIEKIPNWVYIVMGILVLLIIVVIIWGRYR